MNRIKLPSANKKHGFIKSVFLSRYTVLLIAIGGVIYLANLSGGRLVPLTIGLLVFAIYSAYVGFLKKGYVLWRYKSQSAAVIAFLLAYFTAYFSGIEQNGIEIISKQIMPYPNVSEIMLVPGTSKNMVWEWLLDSPDSPDKVISFYKDEQNTRSWTVKLSEPMILLENEKYKLTISPVKNPKGSQIYYSLKKRINEDGILLK